MKESIEEQFQRENFKLHRFLRISNLYQEQNGEKENIDAKFYIEKIELNNNLPVSLPLDFGYSVTEDIKKCKELGKSWSPLAFPALKESPVFDPI